MYAHKTATQLKIIAAVSSIRINYRELQNKNVVKYWFQNP